MRKPILLDNPPPPPLPSVRWSRFMETRCLPIGGLAAGGLAAVFGASVALAMLMPASVTPTTAAPNGPARAAVVDVAPAGPVAANPIAAGASTGVQIIGDVKQSDRPCEEQTWPYIAAHCLKRAADPQPAAAKVAVDRSELKTARAGLPSLPTTPAIVPEQKTVVEAAPVVQPVQAAAAQAQAPLPSVRPAVRDQRPKTVSRAQPRDIRPDTRAEARRAYASQPNPGVRHVDTVYDVPDRFGGMHRVTVIRPQSLHQAAAFSDER
jgi:hypothetical protein